MIYKEIEEEAAEKEIERKENKDEADSKKRRSARDALASKPAAGEPAIEIDPQPIALRKSSRASVRKAEEQIKSQLTPQKPAPRSATATPQKKSAPKSAKKPEPVSAKKRILYYHTI